MYMLRKGTSTYSTCMEWLRELFFNIRLVVKYVNTKSNLIADTLSRVMYLKSEGEARKCLQGTLLCCIKNLFTYCRERSGENVQRSIGQQVNPLNSVGVIYALVVITMVCKKR